MPTKPITPETDTAAPAAAAITTIRNRLQPFDRDAHVKGFGFAQHQQIQSAADETERRQQEGEKRGYCRTPSATSRRRASPTSKR